MTGAVIAVGVLLVLLAWLFWPSEDAGSPTTSRRPRPGVNEAELEAAERDVQAAPDEESVRDWGPGASKPPLA